MKLAVITPVVLIALFFNFSSSISDEYSCRDENNNPIDWFYMYKLPRNKFSKNPLIKLGVAYMYMTPETMKDGWTISKKSINDTTSIPGLTFAPLYEKTEDQIAVLYSDQIYQKRAGKRKKVRTAKKPRQGHTKGVLLGGEDDAIWVVHSVPKYPPSPDDSNLSGYAYTSNGLPYGQSFLCLSLKSSQLQDVGTQMTFNEPKVYYSHIPKKWEGKFSQIVRVLKNDTVSKPPWYNIINMTTTGGMTYTSYAKSSNYNGSLYGLIADTLQTDMYTETWINGPGVLESNCSAKYSVHNIEKVAFIDKQIAFSSHADHSKWAVSVPDQCSNSVNDYSWVCIGDINRNSRQLVRGGGTVCAQNKDVWKQYVDSINEVEPCSAKYVVNL